MLTMFGVLEVTGTTGKSLLVVVVNRETVVIVPTRFVPARSTNSHIREKLPCTPFLFSCHNTSCLTVAVDTSHPSSQSPPVLGFEEDQYPHSPASMAHR